MTKNNLIAFQGEPGAYSQLACREFCPEKETLPCATFEDAFQALEDGQVSLAMIPIENSIAGRVADIHHLLPHANVYIVAEHFLGIRHQLMAPMDTVLDEVEYVLSHTHALGQCRDFIRSHGLKAQVVADTAGAARIISEQKNPKFAAIASSLAAEIHGLEILQADVEDAGHNTTRFLLLSNEPDDAEPEDEPVITSFMFRVRNVPAALYKAMGGFATNGVNMTKLESYQLEGTFRATMFYADIEGHPSHPAVQRALEELNFFTSELRILGAYKAAPYRAKVDEGLHGSI